MYHNDSSSPVTAPSGPAASRFPHPLSKSSNANGDNTGFSHGAYSSNQQSVGGYAERHPRRANVASINTGSAQANGEMSSPATGFDMQFTPLLPSQLLLGSPFQPGSPSTFASPQFASFGNFPQPQFGAPQNNQQGQVSNGNQGQQIPLSPQLFQNLVNPAQYGGTQLYSPQSPTFGFTQFGTPGAGAQAMGPTQGMVTGTSRTVYLGNIPPETSAEEILGHVRSGQIESVRLLPDKNCAFISFLDGSSATHFHSDAILKKLAIRGQDIKVGWGKPSQVPTSVALAVQQSGASRNVYLGNLPEDVREAELREDLGKFGPIDTVKIVREKAIGFVHFLSIGNAIKAVSQLPQEPKWQSPRRVYYGKDRCAYVSKTQQQNAAQYLGIAPGYAHVLNGADRDLISNALAQQSVAAAAVATSAGGVSNLGNRTVYLGNIHPETTIEEVCNVVRGGLLHHIRYIPDKHICFVTFIDPTSAASFYALSNLQGLMIHNRRLKIGWGKHSGALPPAIALAVSGGASRNVYIGNLDESWTEERLRQDFSEYGEIELVNALREKSCAFVNYTNIANAIKAIEAVRGREEYRRFKINFGKDRCGNPPRQAAHHNQQQQQQQQQHQGQQMQQGQPGQINGGLGRADGYSPQGSTPGGLQPSLSQNGSAISPALSPAPGSTGAGSSNGQQSHHAPTPSAILNAGNNNPLTMYLNHVSSQGGDQQQQQQQQLQADPYSVASLQQQQQQVLAAQQAALYGGTGGDLVGGAAMDVIQQQQQQLQHSGAQFGTNGLSSTATTMGGLLAPSNAGLTRQHARALSMPAFSQGSGQNAFGQGQQQQPGQGGQFGQQQQSQLQQHHHQPHHQHQHSSYLPTMSSGFGGIGNGTFSHGAGAYGLAIQADAGLPRWAEEEAGAQ